MVNLFPREVRRVLNLFPRELIESTPKDFPNANPKLHQRPDPRPKTRGVAVHCTVEILLEWINHFIPRLIMELMGHSSSQHLETPHVWGTAVSDNQEKRFK